MSVGTSETAEQDRSAKCRRGYVLIYRSIIESAVFLDAGVFRLFVLLLLKACHKPREVTIRTGRGTKKVLLDVGQCIIGTQSLAEKLRHPKSTIRRWLAKLKANQQISIESDPHYSIVTICNWATYQTRKKNRGAATNEESGSPTGPATGAATGPKQRISNKELGNKEREAARGRPSKGT
ncbi:MAG: hypothetical protein K8U03_01405 [Planctomycetia bacterium]|nr:hypothetical protein [Planctomycetia bacterium]